MGENHFDFPIFSIKRYWTKDTPGMVEQKAMSLDPGHLPSAAEPNLLSPTSELLIGDILFIKIKSVK